MITGPDLRAIPPEDLLKRPMYLQLNAFLEEATETMKNFPVIHVRSFV
jgi:hypothetical protein